MSKEFGKIIKIDERQMILKIPTVNGCRLCKTRENCSFHGPESAYREMVVSNQKQFSVGDMVTIEILESAKNVSALIIFGLPIPLLIGCYLLAEYYFNIPMSEIWGVIAGFGLYGLGLYFSNHWLSRLPQFTPKITKVEAYKNKNVKFPK